MLISQDIEIIQLIPNHLKKPEQEIHLYDRDLGQQLRQEIEHIISSSRKKAVFYLDFKGIDSIDFSCADELIGKLISRLLTNEYGDIFFVLKNLNDNQLENIQVALDRRKVACLRCGTNSECQLLGYTKNYLTEMLEIISQKGKITARELSEALNLELNTSSTRLSHLHKAHLVHREQILVNGGGREYLYHKLI